MKKIKLIFLLVTATMFLNCKKYLDLPPRNKRAVETLQDVKSVLAGYLDAMRTKYTSPIIGSFPVMTGRQVMMFEAFSDNIDFEGNLQKFVNPMNINQTEDFYANFLLWNPFGKFDVPGEIWQNYYSTIGFLNALIDQMKDIKDGTSDEQDRILGEMKVHRAFYFFKLLEYFAPYENADLGIPVYLHSGEKVLGVPMPRRPQIEVYKVIIDDLKTALSLVQQSAPRASFNIFYNERYINNLIAQVYWWKAESAAKETSDYKDAKQFSLAAIKNVAPLLPKTTADINMTARGMNIQYPAFYQSGNMYGEIAPIYGSTLDYVGFQPAGITVSPNLYNLFTTNDIRKAAYFNGNAISSSWPEGAPFGPKNVHIYLFQPEEAYLILAEAQYRLNETNDCIQTLNEFKNLRNSGTADGLNGDPLLQEIINERRREFFTNSDKRWLDLKRYGRITISRSLSFFGKNYSISVKPKDFHYALPIPLTELQQNNQMIQNDGWVPIIF